MTGEPVMRRAGDPVPKIMSVKMVMRFADGRQCTFEANEPARAEIKVEHAPLDLGFGQAFFPADPDVISGVSFGEIVGVTLRIKAGHGADGQAYRIGYSDRGEVLSSAITAISPSPEAPRLSAGPSTAASRTAR